MPTKKKYFRTIFSLSIMYKIFQEKIQKKKKRKKNQKLLQSLADEFITKCDRNLLQSASGIAKYDKVYYEACHVLQKVAIITNCGSTPMHLTNTKLGKYFKFNLNLDVSPKKFKTLLYITNKCFKNRTLVLYVTYIYIYIYIYIYYR